MGKKTTLNLEFENRAIRSARLEEAVEKLSARPFLSVFHFQIVENRFFPPSSQVDSRMSSDQDEDPDFDSDDESGHTGLGTAVVTKPKNSTKTPSLYRVILLNDDFTPMDFVIHVLQKFFNKDYTEATTIMMQVHEKGAGVCGVFSYEIAETKVYHVNQYSKQNQHPLKCIMEKT